MLTLTRKGNKVLVKGTTEELDLIDECLSTYIDGAHFSQKFKDHVWDGYIRFFYKRWGYFYFGHITRVVEFLKKNKVSFLSIGFDDRDISWVKFSEFFISSDRYYQRDSVLQFLKKGYGIIKVPTRGGKTFIASEVIRLISEQNKNLKTLFIVDSIDLFNQAPDDISKVTGISKEEIGKIQESNFDLDKDITIAMIQTLQSIFNSNSVKNKQKKKELEKYLKQVGLVIVDEVQEFGNSKQRLSILRKIINAEWNLCISATPYKDEDEKARLTIDSFSGGVLYEVEEEVLVDIGVLADNQNLFLYLEQKSLENKYSDILNDLIIFSEERNRLLLKLIDICKELNLKTLVMFSSVKHGDHISNLTSIPFLSGENNSKQRETQKEKFLEGKGGVLLASDIWKKGITLPPVEVLINASGGKESSLVIQRRGRILGVTETKKKAMFIDIIDDDGGYLSEHSERRIKAISNRVNKDRLKFLDANDLSKNKVKIEERIKKWFYD